MSHMNGPRTGRSPTFGTRAMVASSHTLATSAGLRALARGGSAVDAVIAVNAVLCVAYPHMAGVGGDGVWLFYDPRKGRVECLNATGPSAGEATRAHYRELGHEEEIPATGPASVLCVPGAVDGWRLAHERYGRLPWRDLFTDAIRYAREGVPVTRSLSDALVELRGVLEKHAPSSRIYLPDGRKLRTGEKLVQRDLSEALRQIAEQGPREGFYEGDLARRICDAVREEGSPLAPEDFARYEAEWVTPLSTTYRGYTAYESPPNSQGFTGLQILNILEAYDFREWGDGSADYLHHVTEACKLAFSDRDEWLTDPRFVDVPVERFISKAYAEERRGLIDRERAKREEEDVRSGIPFGEGARREAVPLEARRAVNGSTASFAAVDEDGLVVSAIQSLAHEFGSGVVAEGTGILLHNYGSLYSLDEGRANCLEPLKKGFHTLAPALLLRDGAPYLAFGSMGGEGETQTQVAIVNRLVDFGFDVQQAIEAPRCLSGSTWSARGRRLQLEGRVSDEVARELKRRGHEVSMLLDWAEECGQAQVIRIHAETGFLEGGADPRGDGAAMGF